MDSLNWVRGCSLVVKPDVAHPFTGYTLGSKQGRLLMLGQERNRICIEWDSVTLKSLSPADLLEHEACGIPWFAAWLSVGDVLPATARDSEEDVRTMVATLEKQYSWLSLGEQGKRIRQIIHHEERPDFQATLRIWHTHLQEHLLFPFVATVNPSLPGPIRQGEQVKVTGMSVLDEDVGTIVRVRLKRRVYHLPVRDIRAIDAPHERAQLIEDYAVWFARHRLIYARILS